VPEYDPKIDYCLGYYRLFQDNEKKLQEYDKLKRDREADLKLYRKMKNGDFSHLEFTQELTGGQSSSSEARSEVEPSEELPKIEAFHLPNSNKKRPSKNLEVESIEEPSKRQKIGNHPS